jgi:hypothetical protein
MKMNVHYAVDSGEIISWGNAEYEHGSASHFDGHRILMLPHQFIHHSTHKVDLKTLTIVEKTVEA